MANQLFKQLIDAFGHIYVLTLSNRQDRRDLMNAQFDAFDIPRPDTDRNIRWFYGTPFPHNKIILGWLEKSQTSRHQILAIILLRLLIILSKKPDKLVI